jgi:hypothetical protein
MDLKRIRDGADWSDHPHGIFKAGTQGWQQGSSFQLLAISSQLLAVRAKGRVVDSALQNQDQIRPSIDSIPRMTQELRANS